jgi:histidine triad (HIT) family protein
VIPRRHVRDVQALTDADAELVAGLMRGVRRVAEQEHLGSYRLVSNVGAEAGQSVEHLHFHVLGGRPMSWPPG